jgi:glycosyltransferase involved in cell wall biosynthesis
VIIAPFSGVPYVTYPYGADLLESPFGSDRLLKCPGRWRRAAAHIFGGGNFFRIGDLLGLRNSTYVPILVDTDLYAPKEMPALREELLAGEEGTVFFAPARHNWEWKGNDKIIRAVKLLAERTGKKFKILFAKWGGGDLEKSLKLVEELGVSERCVFLGAMSKPVLHDYIRASDVVLDQFTLGEYGTLALEAMSLERPVIVHMNSLKNGVPLVKAFSTEEIAGAMTDLLENPAKAKDIGRRSREWVVAHHGPAAIVPKFLKVFDSVANGEDAPKFEMLMD